jgi:sulfate permease, SulP family
VILLITVVAARLTGYFAMSALAALLIVTAWAMSEPHRWRERMRLKAGDRTMLFLTMALTVFADLTIAIAVGTTAGLALRLIRKDVKPKRGNLRTALNSGRLMLALNSFRTVAYLTLSVPK